MAKKKKVKVSKQARIEGKKKFAQSNTPDGEDWGAVIYEFNYQNHSVDSLDYIGTFSDKDRIRFIFPLKNQFNEFCDIQLVTNMDISQNGFVTRLIAVAKIFEDSYDDLYLKAQSRCDYLKANEYGQKSRLLEELIDSVKNGYYVFI